MARRDRGTKDDRLHGEADGGGLALDTVNALPPTGPHDGDALDPEVTEAAGLVDFGSIRVPVPPEGTVAVEPTANGRMQAVHIALPEGRLSVSALAAPKTSKLWTELAAEIDASLREGGARVRSYPGDWGRELHATSGGATSVFVGVDGARWMLYGVATGPTADAATLDAELRRMLRGTVVVRGKQPYPVRTILPLTVPDHIAAEAVAAPAVTASKKRSAAKAGAGKSAPGKTAPGKTAPPNSDAATAAAKKAAARRAAARKAAAAAAVRAAAEALAEQAAEDRAATGEDPDLASGRAARTGAYPVPGTIPTGPGPDAPLREQAPSARRAAAAAWRKRPVAPSSESPPPTEALPVARPDDVPPVTEAIPAAPAARADLPPTEALRRVEPGSGGRRRLGEPAPAAPPPSGRRHLQDSPLEEPRGRRRLQEPAAELLPRDRRYPEVPDGGRRRLHEPDGVLGATAPWDLNAPDGRREPVADSGVSASGRRRLREPWEAGPRPPAEPFGVEPRDERRRPGAADTGVSASGRRRLREPGEPVADTGVSATGRRRLRESWDEAAPPPRETGRGGPDAPGGRRRLAEPAGFPAADPLAPGAAAADTGVSASGRRRLREPWDEPAAPRDTPRGSNGFVADTGVSATGRRRSDEAPGFPGAAPRELPAADAGVSATGRRRLREPWEEAGPAAAPPSWETGSGGRRRLREPWDETGSDAGPPEPVPARFDGPGTGGRRAREPFGEPGPTAGSRPGGAAADTGVSASGRRRLHEPWEGAGVSDAGVSASGRRRLREPWEEAGPGPDGLTGTGGRPWSGEPDPLEPSGRRRRADTGEDPLAGPGGRRRLREPEPDPAPARDGAQRDGTQTEPWLHGPDPGARRTLNAEYLVETGEQASGWAAELDGYAERRGGGRHSGSGDGSPPTVRLQALLGELDPNRPRRRHRR